MVMVMATCHMQMNTIRNPQLVVAHTMHMHQSVTGELAFTFADVFTFLQIDRFFASVKKARLM